MSRIKNLARYLLFLSLIISLPSFSTSKDNDPHYTKNGFFDIHVCNWPDRSPFLLALFSSLQFNEIKSVEILSPAGISIGQLDLNKFRTFTTKKKQLKKAFIKHFSIPKPASDGWYSAIITLNNNKQLIAKDFVQHKLLPIVSDPTPKNNASNINLPTTLHWKAIPGAKFYQIFITDLWQDGKVIHTSKLLNTNSITLPKDLLQKGGLYNWRIHARDINENIKLGDFNHGSLSTKLSFSIAE